MPLILNILVGVSLLVVLATLIMGFIAMTDKSDAGRERSNKLMWWRVRAQGAAILIFIIAIYMKGKGA